MMEVQFRSSTRNGGMRKLRPAVGISLFARDGQAIWENGIHQNIAFLAMMLKRSDQIGPVWFLNGGDARALPPGSTLTASTCRSFNRTTSRTKSMS